MPSTRKIVFATYDDIQSLDLTGPWEVFNAANTRVPGAYELVAASLFGESVTSSSGLRLEASVRLSGVRGLDTLLVPGGTGTRDVVREQPFLAEIRRLSGLARRTAGVCSGSFILGAAGLLDGRRAVTHWAYCDELAGAFPEAEIDPDPIYVRDGDLITSAGVTAGIDLALALVEEDHGPELALEVARWLVVYAQRPGGQSQFSVQLAHRAASSDPIRELQSWIGSHLAEDLSVAALAGRVHLSERQLARRFRTELGATPADYVEQARVEAARALLEDGSEGLEAVAARCGFASAEVMRRAFQRRLGTSPSGYRERFRLTAA
jgi:transcriptional regulator GlxA family with amidase domain